MPPGGSTFFLVLLHFLFSLPIFTFPNPLGSLRCFWTTTTGACAKSVAARLSLPAHQESRDFMDCHSWGPHSIRIVVDGQLTRTRSPGEVTSFVEYLTFFLLYEELPPYLFLWRLDVIPCAAFAGHRYRSFADIDDFRSDGPGRAMAYLHTQPLTGRGCGRLRLLYHWAIWSARQICSSRVSGGPGGHLHPP